jgi:hypothetical protein
LRATSDQTCLLQSIQKTKEIGLVGKSDFLRLPVEVQRMCLALGGESRPTFLICYRKSSGFARDFRVTSLPTTMLRSDFSMGSRR